MEQKFSISKFLPVLFGFFIMGFVDAVGISTSYIMKDFGLTDTQASMIPFGCFLSFLIFSIPVGVLMNKIGRKNTVLISYLVQGLGLVVPILNYSVISMVVAFALIGIGNTFLQVSLNPLVTNVVSKERLTTSLTFGVFVKAAASLLGPIITAWGAGMAYGWQVIFPVYAALSLLATIWLSVTTIPKEHVASTSSSFGAAFGLLKDRYILLFFIGILVLVGVDVGANITFPKYVMERTGLDLTSAGYINSIYFFARSLAAFFGALLLMKLSTQKIFVASVFIALAGLLLMLLSDTMWMLWGCAILFGIGYANLFSIIFSLSMQRVPEKANEVSALLITGVFGGALLPPILGITSDAFNQWAAILLMSVVWCYLVFLFPQVKKIAN